MKTALDLYEETLDDSDRNFLDQIRMHGWFRTSVFGDDEGPGFSYTTGFWLKTGHPEFIIFSLKRETAHNVLWDLYRVAQSGEKLPVGRRCDQVFGNGHAYLFPVAQRHYADHLGFSRFFYEGDDFPCLQIVWSDRDDVFPWEPGFDRDFVGLQIDLTEDGWTSAILD
jgi:hypothetical protein